MISSKHPAFAKLVTKLDRAGHELGKIDGYLDSIKDSDRPVNEWARGSALAPGVHNIYNGVEDVMLNLANDVDGYVPTGESAHQDLLDQMSAAIDGKRPALPSRRVEGFPARGPAPVRVRPRLVEGRRESCQGTHSLPGVRRSRGRFGAGDDRGEG